METEVVNEAFVFICSVPFGIAVAVLYDFFRVLRIVFSKGCFVTFVEDLIFWALTATGAVLFFFVFTNGCIRGYVFFGAALGAVLYFCTVSLLVLKAMRFAAEKMTCFLATNARRAAKRRCKLKENLKKQKKN